MAGSAVAGDHLTVRGIGVRRTHWAAMFTAIHGSEQHPQPVRCKLRGH